MTESTKLQPMAIVAAVTDDELAAKVLTEAAERAAAYGDAMLHVVRVVPRSTQRTAAELDALAAELLGYATNALKNVRNPRARQVELLAHVRVGKPVDRILEVARSNAAELIVLGVDPKPGRLGSVARGVLEEAGCTVRIVGRRPWLDRPTDPHVAERPMDHGRTRRLRWTWHDSDATGPTGIPMVAGVRD